MSAPTTLYRRADGAASAVVDGDTVILSPSDMRYHALNSTAAAIWDELTEPRSLDTIVTNLSERYEVDVDTCRADVQACLATMTELGVVSSPSDQPG